MVKALSLQRKQPPAPNSPKPVTPQHATLNQSDGPVDHNQEQAILAFQQHHGNRQTGQLIQRLRAQHSTAHRQSVQRLFSLKPTGKTSKLDTYVDREQVQLNDAPTIANQLISQKDQLKQLLNTKPLPKSSSLSDATETPSLGDEVDKILNEDNKDNVVEAIQAMIVSSVDEGVFDFENSQQQVLFFTKVRQWLTSGQIQNPIDSSDEVNNQRQFEDTMWSSYQTLVASDARQNDGVKFDTSIVFKTAVLGAGASAAYYLVNAASSLDFESTVVVGNLQPWAKERGALGSINHPHNMINPEYQDEDVDALEGLAQRSDFSKVLANLFAKLGDRRFKQTGVKSVLKKKTSGGTYYYRIETEQGIVYAQNVIAVMGIGKHKLPDNVTAQMIEKSGTLDDAPDDEFKKKEGENAPKFKRIMSLDEFQRMVDGLKKGNKKLSTVAKKVAIIGPNASIDAMTTVLREQDIDLEITWVSGAREPPFLPGTDNSFTKGKYRAVTKKENKQDDAPSPALKEVKAKRPEKTDVYKEGKITIVKHDFVGMTPHEQLVDVKYGSRDDKDNPFGTQTVDIAVYGMGPDESALRGTFKDDHQDVLENLKPIYDINSRVNTQGTPLDKLVEMLGPKRGAVEKILDLSPIERTKDKVGQWLPSVVGFEAQNEDDQDETSLQLIGGTGSRLGAKVEYKFISQMLDGLHEDFNEMLLTDWMELGFNQTERGLLNNLAMRLAKYIINARKAATKLEDWKPSKTMSSERDANTRLGRAKQETVAIESAIEDCKKLQADVKEAFDIAQTVIDKSNWRDNPKTGQVGDVYLKKLWSFVGQFEKGQLMLEEYLTKRQTGTALDQFGAQAASFMTSGIINTLPNNVLLPDQLTPSRSGIEVLQNAMPSTVSEGINFITSDNTIIAAHIASGYDNIPELLADYVTERIIFDRRNLKDEDSPLPQSEDLNDPNATFNLKKQAEFQKRWYDTLEKLNGVF